MAQVVYRTSSISGTNADKKRNGTVTGSFYHSSGTIPPSGSTLQSVKVYFSSVNVYSSTAGFSTAYGSVSLGSSSGSHNCTMNGASSSIINFTGGSMTFTVTGGSSTTSNVLNVRSGSYIEITINYVPSSSSTGSLNATSVQQSGSITLTINPASSGFTHKVQWYRDSSHYEYQDCGSDTTATFTIPAGWPVGDATAQIMSYYGGNYVGSSSCSFIITVDPSTVIPTAGTLTVYLSQPSSVPSSWGVYVKGYSRALLYLSNHSAGSGASYQSIAFTCGQQGKSSQDGNSYTTDVLLETGEVRCNAVITNNYGNTASPDEKTITVYDYFSPVFDSVVAYRCTSTGVPSATGTYISVTASVSVADVGGKNSLSSLQAQIAPVGSSSWGSAVTLTNGSTRLISGASNASVQYQVRVTAIDTLQNNGGLYSRTTVSAVTSEHVIYCMDGGLNVSIGKEGTRQRAFEINGAWDIYHGDTKLNGTVPVERGGTGATTAENARQNLGAASTSHSHSADDVTSGTLPIARGGTGASTADGAILNLGITPAKIGAAEASHEHSASDLSGGSIASSMLPFKIDWGSGVSLNGVSWSTVYFGRSFSYAPTVIVSYSGASGTTAPLKVGSVSTGSFQVCMIGNSGSGTRYINWIAIGG